jgi:hypothetical protein
MSELRHCRWCERTDKHDRRSCRMTALNREYNADHEHQRKATVAKNIKRRGTGVGYVKENCRHQHRTVAEEKIGRSLRPGEIVHHIDGDKQNNGSENLEVLASHREHMERHARAPYVRTAEHRALMSARIKGVKSHA